MNQPSINSPRRPGRWMRLALLIAGVGALSLIGAVLGRGLGAPDSGGAEAQAVGTPAAVALASTPGVATPAAAPLTDARLPATVAPAPPTQAQPIPAAPSPSVAPAATMRPVQRQQGAGGADQPKQLPHTGGDDSAPVVVLALALVVIGLALCMMPRAVFGRPDEKE